MLADFLFSETHIDDAVMVSIGTDPDGLSYGRLTFPVAVREAMSWDQYPSLLGPSSRTARRAFSIVMLLSCRPYSL
jgi:hypothetical protein